MGKPEVTNKASPHTIYNRAWEIVNREKKLTTKPDPTIIKTGGEKNGR